MTTLNLAWALRSWKTAKVKDPYPPILCCEYGLCKEPLSSTTWVTHRCPFVYLWQGHTQTPQIPILCLRNDQLSWLVKTVLINQPLIKLLTFFQVPGTFASLLPLLTSPSWEKVFLRLKHYQGQYLQTMLHPILSFQALLTPTYERRIPFCLTLERDPCGSHSSVTARVPVTTVPFQWSLSLFNPDLFFI